MKAGKEKLGKYGIWSSSFRALPMDEIGVNAALVEELGFGAAWIPGGSQRSEVLDRAEGMLSATGHIAVASGILNIWMHDATEVARRHAEIQAVSNHRFMMGIGISHAPLIDRMGAGTFQRPLAKTAQFLDDLDSADPPVPLGERMLAALAPKMVELARSRAAGSHTYNVPPAHTAWARGILGPDRILAPEQGVILVQDATEARAIGRSWLRTYARLPHYTNAWWRFGFDESRDLADGDVSDRIVDGVLAWGSVDQVLGRVQAHIDAGADHVCINVITGDDASPAAQWRLLAAGLGLGR